MNRIVWILNWLICLSFAKGDMDSCAFIRRTEISALLEGPVFSGASHRYTNYTAGPNNWHFLRYLAFLDAEENILQRTGLAIELEGKDYWASSDKPPLYYPCQPPRIKLPKKVRTRDDGFAVYAVFEPRAIPNPNVPYWYTFLGQVFASAKTFKTQMEFVISERSTTAEPKPYWYLYKDGEWGFWYGSGATIGNGFRTFAQYPPVKPGTPPPPYDFGKDDGGQKFAAAVPSVREELSADTAILCRQEQEFLDGLGEPKILWCRLHYNSEPNQPDSGQFSWRPIQTFIPFEDWSDPNEIAAEAELISPVFLAENAGKCFAELLISLEPNEPNAVFPFLLNESARKENRICYRPLHVVFTVADCNEPMWLTEPHTGWDLMVVPAKAGKIHVRYRENAPLDLIARYSEKWLSNYPPFDMDNDRKVSYRDF